MFRLFIVILLSIASASTSRFKFSVLKTVTTVGNETRGIVDPTSCGCSVGAFIEMRVSDCEGDTTSCRLTASSEIEIDFRASENSTNAKLTLIVTPIDGTPESENELIGPMPGEEDLTLVLTDFGEIITSQEVALQIEILNDDNKVEICLLSSFNKGIVPPSTISTDAPTTITIPNSSTTTSGSTSITIPNSSTISSGSTGTAGGITARATILFGIAGSHLILKRHLELLA